MESESTLEEPTTTSAQNSTVSVARTGESLAGAKGMEGGNEGDDGDDHHRDEMCHPEGGAMEEHQDGDHLGIVRRSDNPKGLEDMVNEVLSNKLEGFQAQMQNMFSMIQRVAGEGVSGDLGSAPTEESMEGGSEGVGQVAGPEGSDQREQTESMEGGSEGVGQVAGPEGSEYLRRQEERERKKELQEFLGTVSSILDLPIARREDSCLDDATGSESSPCGVQSLPIEVMVKNCLQMGGGDQLPNRRKSPHKHLLKKYPLSRGDYEAHGKLPNINLPIWRYANNLEGSGQAKQRTRGVKELDTELRDFENALRVQQRVFSYCSYYLAALGKKVGDSATDEDVIPKLVNYLGEGLADACGLSVYGLQAVTKARRRVWLDAVNLRNDGLHKTIQHRPHSEQLFHPSLETSLKQVIPGFDKGHPPPGGVMERAQKNPKKKKPDHKQRLENWKRSRRSQSNQGRQNDGGGRQQAQVTGLTIARGGRNPGGQSSVVGRSGNKRQRMSTGVGNSSQRFGGAPSASAGCGADDPWSAGSTLTYGPSLFDRAAAGGGSSRYADARMSTFFDTEGTQGSDDDDEYY